MITIRILHRCTVFEFDLSQFDVSEDLNCPRVGRGGGGRGRGVGAQGQYDETKDTSYDEDNEAHVQRCNLKFDG